MRRYPTMILLAAAGLSAACTAGPDYHPPSIAVEPDFSELDQPGVAAAQPATQLSGATSNATPAVEWWRAFNDPELTGLIGRALRSNFDLQIATARIYESRAQRNVLAADLFPDVDANASYTHAKGSSNVDLPLGGLGTGGNAPAAAHQPSAVEQVAGAAAPQSVGPATPPPASPLAREVCPA